MGTCEHGRPSCPKCGSCPLCPGCVCVGQKRGRGRLRKGAESFRPVTTSQPTVTDQGMSMQDHSSLHGLITRRKSGQAIADNGALAHQRSKDLAILTDVEEQEEADDVDRLALYRRLILNHRDRRDIPDLSSRQRSFASMTSVQQRAIIRVLDRVLAYVAKDLVPNDTDHVIAEFKTRKCFNSDLLKTIVKGINATPRGSTERRTLRACLCATTGADEVRDLLANDGTEAEAESTVDYGTLGPGPSDGRLIESNEGVAIADASASDRITPGELTPTTRAPTLIPILSAPVGEIDEEAMSCVPDIPLSAAADEPSGYSDAEPESTAGGSIEYNENIALNRETHSKRKRSGSFQRMFSRSRAEWNYILTHGSVPPTVKRSVKRVDDNILRVVLEFLLRPENLWLSSNGAKRIRQGTKWSYFPAFLRRTACEHMFRNYVMYVDEKLGPSGATIGRTTFLRIIQVLTRGEQYRNLAVDRFMSVLVRGNLDTVRRIIRIEVRDTNCQAELMRTADSVEDFLRFVHMTHISSNMDCAHNVGHGLLQASRPSGQVSPNTTCSFCLIPFQFIQNVRAAMGVERTEAMAALNSARNKIFLYMGHHMRCYNQSRMVSEVFAQLASAPPGSAAVLLMDFRERIELIRLKEKVVEMHGRKGMSWHGTVAFMRRASSPELRKDSCTTPEELSTCFLNHVVSDDTVQDGITTGSILEAVLERLRVEHSGLKQVWLLSDDSKCYQNIYLPVIAPFIAHKHGMRLQAHIYTEMAQTKAVVDAHFATAMDRVNRFCKEMKQDVTTPIDLSRAIGYRGGVLNSTVELIQVNRTMTKARKWLDAKRTGRLSRMERADKIVYDEVREFSARARMFKYFGAPPSNWELGFCYSQWSGGAPVNGDELMEVDGDPGASQTESPKDMNGVFSGLVTDVTVLTRTPIRRSVYRGVVRAMAAIEDALAELCGDDEFEEGEHGDEKEVEPRTDSQLPICERCGRLYLYFSALEMHKTKCSGPMESGIVQDRVPTIAREVLSSLDMNTFSSAVSSVLTKVNPTEETRGEVQFGTLWARRLPCSQSLGENTVMKYSKVIDDWFDRGYRGRKISANGMLHQLVLDRPWCYDFPSEHHISQYLYSIARDHGKPAWTTPGGRGRRGMPQKYVLGLERLLKGTPNLKPRDARDALTLLLDLNKNDLPADFPSEQALKNKVSNLKWSMRELAARNESSDAARRKDDTKNQISTRSDVRNSDSNAKEYGNVSRTIPKVETNNAVSLINSMGEGAVPPSENTNNLPAITNVVPSSTPNVHMPTITPNIISYSAPFIGNMANRSLPKHAGSLDVISMPIGATTAPSSGIIPSALVPSSMVSFPNDVSSALPLGDLSNSTAFNSSTQNVGMFASDLPISGSMGMSSSNGNAISFVSMPISLGTAPLPKNQRISNPLVEIDLDSNQSAFVCSTLPGDMLESHLRSNNNHTLKPNLSTRGTFTNIAPTSEGAPSNANVTRFLINNGTAAGMNNVTGE